MMRWILLAGVVVAVSATITVGLQQQNYLKPDPQAGTVHAGPAAPTGPTGEATVLDDSLTHDFGTMPQWDQGARTWTIKNTGEGPLSITVGNTTCSCTIANVEKGTNKVLEPGETTEIRLGWNTKDWTKFSQSAEILTNDPKRQVIKLQITGEVRPALIVAPLDDSFQPGEGLSFTNIPNDESKSQSFALFSLDHPELVIKSLVVANPLILEAEARPLSDEAKKRFDLPGNGNSYEVVVTLKPGKKLGDFQDELVIDTDHPKKSETRVKLGGRIVGPINVVPPGTRMTVNSKQGGSKPFVVWVRDQPETHFEVVSAPEGLKVDIQPSDQKSAKARAYKLVIAVPPDTADQIIDGVVVLKTDHPRADEIRVPVTFTVAGSGN